MSAYTIMISDDQRTALRDLIANANADAPDQPLEFWLAMPDDLPNHNDNPQTVHGFCL